jgi:tetratricopeptide (TPR) repeat protein
MLSVVSAGGHAVAQTSQASAPKSVVAPQAGGGEVQKLQGRRLALFQAMLQKPDDLDAAFEYAALSVQVGDLEAAISTLERMLIFSPGLPRLQLELGLLYYRLAAFETARTYFQAAISGPEVPEEVRVKVQQYLTGIDLAGETNRFAGQVRAGIRYQSNANRAPTNGIIILNGLPFVLDPSARGASDGNVYGAGVFHLSHNLPSQGDTIEADLVAYGSKQFHLDELDVALAELTVGPAFDMGRFGIDNAALGVYGIGSFVFVDGNFYSAAGGVGTRFVIQPQPGFSWTTALEYRYRGYHDSDDAPTASFRNGDEIRAYSNATYVLSPTIVLGAGAYIQHSAADQGYLAYTEGGFAAGPRYSFDSPLHDDRGDWTVYLNAGGVLRSYEDPDPAIDAAEAERDWEAFVGAGLTVPMTTNVALLAETEYRHVDSNYSTRQYDNFTVSLSIARGF